MIYCLCRMGLRLGIGLSAFCDTIVIFVFRPSFVFMTATGPHLSDRADDVWSAQVSNLALLSDRCFCIGRYAYINRRK